MIRRTNASAAVGEVMNVGGPRGSAAGCLLCVVHTTSRTNNGLVWTSVRRVSRQGRADVHVCVLLSVVIKLIIALRTAPRRVWYDKIFNKYFEVLVQQ